MANVSTYLEQILAAIHGEEVRGSIHDAIAAMNEESSQAILDSSNAKDSAKNSAAAAKESETKAGESAAAAKESENTASTKAQEASDSADAAAQSASGAKESENTALTKAQEASSSAEAAAQSASEALASETTASTKAQEASDSADAAAQSASEAKSSQQAAADSEEAAAESAKNAAQSEENASSSESSAASYYEKIQEEGDALLARIQQASAFHPRGEYDPGETYEYLDFVYYLGSAYVAKQTTIGNTPAEDDEYWQILAGGVKADELPVIDTSGFVVEPNGETTLQKLIDVIAEQVEKIEKLEFFVDEAYHNHSMLYKLYDNQVDEPDLSEPILDSDGQEIDGRLIFEFL